jgi:hypothetical protein
LMKSILHRYHEEQVWSDKIRSVSTYGSLIVLVVNLVVFLGAIAVVEPWKRRRLVKGLEDRVKGMMETVEGKVEGEMGAVKEMLQGVHLALTGMSIDAATPGLGTTSAGSTSTAKQDVGVQYDPPPTDFIEDIINTPESSHIIPRSLIHFISGQIAKVSPESGQYVSSTDPHRLDTAVVGTLGLVLGAGCMGLIAWFR